MEAKNIKRKTIEKKIKEKFYRSFGEDIRNVRRINYRWECEFKMDSEWRKITVNHSEK